MSERAPRSPSEPLAAVDRRTFVKVVSMAAAAVGLTSAAAQLVEAASKGLKPSVLSFHFQECTGCTESLLRDRSHPRPLRRP